MKKTIDIINKVIFIITNIILIILLIVGSYVFFQVHIKKRKKEDVFSYTMFVVKTGSMQDTININDIIIVKKTKDVEKKDIVAFEQDEKLIVHRVIEKDQDKVITKGDANNQKDEPIKFEQIIGKVVKVISMGFVIRIIIAVISFNIIIWLIEKYIDRKDVLKKGER